MRAGIALGSNLGNRVDQLKSAAAEINALRAVQPPVLKSSLFETEPVDCAPDAPKFLNAVIEVGYSGSAAELLQELRGIEAAAGRPRDHLRNAPRTIDLDLLYFGAEIIREPELELPHPRLRARRFVLAPLAEIRPDLILPGETRSVAELLRGLADATPLLRVASEW